MIRKGIGGGKRSRVLVVSQFAGMGGGHICGTSANCFTKFPWHKHPFRLICWLKMEKFSAEIFYHMACGLGNLSQALDMMHASGVSAATFKPVLTLQNILQWLHEVRDKCKLINLRQSEKCAQRIIDDIGKIGLDNVEIAARINEFNKLVKSEMESELFFWVPAHRADWYGKKADVIAGAHWCARFCSTTQEIEEAAKCYAAGRYTAASFHLMRATEAGTKALGLAIGFTPAHPGWKEIFREVYAQYKNQKPRHSIWKTHEAVLIQISGDLRTISHVWRNDLAHFVDTYNEDEAREMFTIVPIFMRNLSAMIDESGKLY
jgi:hypothetical protein